MVHLDPQSEFEPLNSGGESLLGDLDPGGLGELDLMEVDLQRELRSMFEVDTQSYLENYIQLVQRLHSDSWKADIQELYRYIHTIKGSAVTVGADPVLYVSTALEDLLSELRYLDTAPPLDDGCLSAFLLEAGELLASTTPLTAQGSAAEAEVEPTVARILAIKEQVQSNYLGEWNEQRQLWQEFAEQGFDLVILNFEMALEKLPTNGSVSPDVMKAAKDTLKQLFTIGQDLQFAPTWKTLLQRSKVLFDKPEAAFWQLHWPTFFALLKDSAKQGGQMPSQLQPTRPQPEPHVETISPDPSPTSTSVPVEIPVTRSPVAGSPVTGSPVAGSPAGSGAEVQIAVPLQRLNDSAQTTVDALLNVRTSQELFKTLQAQLQPLLLLAEESAQYITQLRQMQDDYALLNTLAGQHADQDTPTREHYRQGYLTINRLLENSLRLAEIGGEAEKTAQQTEESLSILGKRVQQLQQAIEVSRSVAFRTVGFRARSIVRDLTNRFNKPAQLQLQGETLELDAGTVQKLEPILLHLIRNAFDHGLESSEDRIQRGKPPQGSITLSLQRRGNLYRLIIQDDGQGVDPARIEQIAQQKGMLLTDTSTPEALLEVLCQPGFSSRSEITDISGRGVGMDVVAAEVKKLGGRLTLETTVGQGSCFTLDIPVPYLLVQCILVRAGSQLMAIPSEETTTTSLIELLSLQQVETQNRIRWTIQSENYVSLALDLAVFWGSAERVEFPEDAIGICVSPQADLNRIEEGTAWLIADELMGQSDVLIQTLPAPLKLPAGLLGLSLQADGSLIPVLDPVTLIGQLQEIPSAPVSKLSSTSTAPTIDSTFSISRRSILVVDDAALMRRRLEASLSSYGYTVVSCTDGYEAWQWIQANPQPALMITDIEMPRMDGFTLIDQCRQAEMALPILVISSRLSEEWSREAKRVGATDYLTKGFTTQELISQVRRLLS